MRPTLLNFMLRLGDGNAIPEPASKELIEWAEANKMKWALEVLAKNSARGGADAYIAARAALPREPMTYVRRLGRGNWSKMPIRHLPLMPMDVAP